jgi:hypothetical protein
MLAFRTQVRGFKPGRSRLIFLHFPVTPSLLGPKILLNTLFSNTLGLCSSLNVIDQVSHPYKTTGKIMVLYILRFKFLGSTLEDKRFCTEWQHAFPNFNLLLISSLLIQNIKQNFRVTYREEISMNIYICFVLRSVFSSFPFTYCS